MRSSEVVAEIESLYAAGGDEPYGEAVTMTEHMLLTAQTAASEGAPETLVAACLLHDIGHLLVAPDDEFGKHTHDSIGADWVAERFPRAVSEPVRLHVDAKRYLCAIDPDYHSRLSPASQYTLTKQGGPMSESEVARFESLEYHEDALRLRRWEDSYGKNDDTDAPPFEEFRPLIERLVTP